MCVIGTDGGLKTYNESPSEHEADISIRKHYIAQSVGIKESIALTGQNGENCSWGFAD